MTSLLYTGGNSSGQSASGAAGGVMREWVQSADVQVKEMIARYFCITILTEDGRVGTAGANEFGEHGDGKRNMTSVLTYAVGLTDIVKVAGGGASLSALDSQGRVFDWGADGDGQLGDGKTGQGNASDLPKQVPLPGPAEDIAGAGGFRFAKVAGRWYGWGEDKEGQLGAGSVAGKRPDPIPLPALDGAVELVCGGLPSEGGHTLGRWEDGTIKAWGGNGSGQGGIGSASSKPILTPQRIVGLTGVKELSASESHNLALLEDGTVVGWGQSIYGQLGMLAQSVDTPHPIHLSGPCTQVNAGFRTSGFIVNGDLQTCGWNGHNCLGNGTDEDVHTPTVVLKDVASVEMGEYGSLAIVNGTPPPRQLTVKALQGGWELDWTNAPGKGAWAISQRTAGGTWLQVAGKIDHATHTYTKTGLPSKTTYTLRLKASGFMRLIDVETL